jgi:Raf kinase inhibitor-like YbhB/YbcL family protein
MQLVSSAFENEGRIPSRYTCDGENVSPPLFISDVPAEAKTLVLIMDDHDVPKAIREDGTWDHWVVFDIPATVRELREGTEPPGVHGLGTGGNTGYYGPCPPDREHRYFFRLYALDTSLGLPEKTGKFDVERAMKDHIIDKAHLVGRYERQ